MLLFLFLIAAVRVPRPLDDRGQATPEYGLVIMVAGTIAMALIVWARGTNAITGLFDAVVGRLTEGI
jgi:hypothetical protein